MRGDAGGGGGSLLLGVRERHRPIRVGRLVSQPFGATNLSHTCLWCGRRLGWWLSKKHGQEWASIYPDKTGRGYRGDGLFCSITCGYLFARAFARLGRRLAPLGHGVNASHAGPPRKSWEA